MPTPPAAPPRIAMDLQAQAQALQVLVRADRQVSVSGNLRAQLQEGQFSLTGKLTTDRATIILPMKPPPRWTLTWSSALAARDREAQARAQAAAQAHQKAEQAPQLVPAKPAVIAITPEPGQRLCPAGPGHHHPAHGRGGCAQRRHRRRPTPRDGRGAHRRGTLPRLGPGAGRGDRVDPLQRAVQQPLARHPGAAPQHQRAGGRAGQRLSPGPARAPVFRPRAARR